MLFGDGAGAVVLGPSDSEAGIGPIDLTADGGLRGHDRGPRRRSRFIRMDGHLERSGPRCKRPVGVDHLRRPPPRGSELADIDLFVYHQANSRILKAVGERLELDSAKVADYLAQHRATRPPRRSRSRCH